MYRVMNEYLARVKLFIDERFSQRADLFCADCPEISRYCINVSYNKYVVDIHLKNYSVQAADRLFSHFAAELSFPYSHMSLRYNEEKCVRYRFVTCNEEKNAIYLDLMFS